MYATDQQKQEIFIPKKACQRGLEGPIVATEYGDKQVYLGYKPSYMYINNPIYRVGPEGQVTENAISSRMINNGTAVENLKFSDSALHLLYPTIDSGSVFLSEQPWNEYWDKNREGIPNTFVSQEKVEKHHLKTHEYNTVIDTKIAAREKEDQLNRYLPIYDSSTISNDEEPDGVHDHPHHKRGNNTFTMLKDPQRLIEYYTDTSSGNGTPTKQQNYGKYGSPVPDGYARMGKEHNLYNLKPERDVGPPPYRIGFDGQAFSPDGQVTAGNGTLEFRNEHLGKPYPVQPLKTIDNFKFLQDPRLVSYRNGSEKSKNDESHRWWIFLIFVILFLIVMIFAIQKLA